eukprot:CAMPEP_0172529886 /NCGR_PEP_ID=MMETSP1067-20121228/3829_1 /TAXON_ID=265564 ORGANISM="Thalassiosira punctigera, Strain Tpunct2005C2" /NCGR_SAMPLE_ID=MMETSP1067 /ASSEMBLY_ACC=CAM_ASM_000444 /LENGTH=274 /DNA_ID=CAMNT_0013314015 /DNA_START=188 /DNA_END=1012 /DNA_ORIENTATION=+
MSEDQQKKLIYITVDGKSFVKTFGRTKEVQTFFDSVEDKDDKMVSSFFDGEDTIETIPCDIDVSRDYAKLGTSFRKLQRSLASGDDADADAGASEHPSLETLDSYEDRMAKSFRNLCEGSLAERGMGSEETTEAIEIVYPSLAAVESYEERLGRRFQKLLRISSGVKGGGKAPPSPSSVDDVPSVDPRDDSEKVGPPADGEGPSESGCEADDERSDRQSDGGDAATPPVLPMDSTMSMPNNLMNAAFIVPITRTNSTSATDGYDLSLHPFALEE